MVLIDYVVVGIYLIAIVIVGLLLQRRASAGIDSYFLGNRRLPWWLLGCSGMASCLDVSGTMINTAWIFALGVSGLFIEIRGGVTLLMAFLMIFTGKWQRRAQVMTMAEWMRFRFGEGRQGDVARLVAAISTIVMTIAMLTYFAVGSGKFIGTFLGIPPFLGMSSEFWAATLMIVLAMIYTVASGLYGVVWTDLFQSMLIFAVIAYTAILSFHVALPEVFSISVPLKDGGFQAVQATRATWTSALPRWKVDFPADSAYAIYNLFGISILFYLIKVTIEGYGGGSGFIVQRHFAARSDREAGLLSLFWIFLLSFRWVFIAAIAVLGISYGANHHLISDPETVIPVVIRDLTHTGVRGLMVAGLMAAAMSTFDSTVNAGAAYWVKDIYQAFINPEASERALMVHGRVASVAVVLIGLLFSVVVKNINQIWGWITMSISAGLFIPVLLRWYWWRMNGYGFALGTVAGMVAAVLQRLLLPDVPEYVAFSLASGSSLVGTILGTLATRPTDRQVLRNFYCTTRPFGFWGPVREVFSPQVQDKLRGEHRRDIVSTFMAVPWQLVLFLLWMMVIMHRWDQFKYGLVLLVALSIGLYFTWFRHLGKEVPAQGRGGATVS
ncbi:MAG: sodium:solute symporter [bacterium]|jgi:Na+/proline symporter|nr:sodium:solute symporter [candidate division KSB1 bacterium]MDH7560477.1 sodium:solute symporter [bacterium]